MNEDFYEEDYELEEELPRQNITGVCSALKEAWKLLPNKSLFEVFEITLPSALQEMTDEEVIESLEEFIHQNQ